MQKDILAMKVKSEEMARMVSVMLDCGDAKPESFLGLYVLIHEDDVVLMTEEGVRRQFDHILPEKTEPVEFVRLMNED